MDITNFNKELSYKVAKANGLEKNHKLQEAIDIWLEVSDMAIQFSKRPNLEFSYKSMLIEKTQQIIDHIKELKVEIIDHRAKITQLSGINPPQTIPKPEQIPSEPPTEKKNDKLEKEEEQEPHVEIIENSDLKNLPIGFKEIKAEKDFKIVTPHDQDYIKNLIKKEPELAKPKEKKEPEPGRIKLDQPKDKNTEFCFACGAQVPANSKKCPTCGTKLDED